MASFIRMPRLKAKVDLPESSIYELIRMGEFPPPIIIGKRRAAWVVSEVEDWLAEQIRRSRYQTLKEKKS